MIDSRKFLLIGGLLFLVCLSSKEATSNHLGVSTSCTDRLSGGVGFLSAGVRASQIDNIRQLTDFVPVGTLVFPAEDGNNGYEQTLRNGKLHYCAVITSEGRHLWMQDQYIQNRSNLYLGGNNLKYDFLVNRIIPRCNENLQCPNIWLNFNNNYVRLGYGDNWSPLSAGGGKFKRNPEGGLVYVTNTSLLEVSVETGGRFQDGSIPSVTPKIQD